MARLSPGAPACPARRGALVAGLCLALGLGAAPALADPNGELERQVKAAYLYKFAGFVEWPEGAFARPDSALVIGVAGADALADQLALTVAGHSVNGRALQELLAAARGQSLLIVSDSDEVYARGAMINFVIAQDKLRFEVALKPLSQVNIRISARMLAAAYRVQGAT